MSDNFRSDGLRDDTTTTGETMEGGSMASDGLMTPASPGMGSTSGLDQTWAYRDESWGNDSRDIVGYGVEANDGSIGKVDEASNDASGSHIVVDTGPWIFGTKRLIPAGAIGTVDHDNRKVVVDMTKDQIKNAPEYDAEGWGDDARAAHGDYYRDYTARDDDPRNPL
jgi:hypothetical protein